MRFEEGKHYAFLPADSDTLAVFYSPVERPLGQLPHWKKSNGLPVARLLINPGTDNFFQDCIRETDTLVASHAAGYRRTIHYGYSMGAYAALRFGTADPKAAAIFAMSPHLVLSRPMTRSALKITQYSTDESDIDLIERINRCGNADMYLYLSAVDIMDGIQIADAARIRNIRTKTICLLEEHGLPSVHVPERVVTEYLDHGRPNQPAPSVIANDSWQRQAIEAYKLFVAASQQRQDADLPSIDVKCASHPAVHYCYGRYLASQDRHRQALEHFWRCETLIEEFVWARGYRAENMVCAGNSAAAIGLREVARGYFMQANEWDQRNSPGDIPLQRLMATA